MKINKIPIENIENAICQVANCDKSVLYENYNRTKDHDSSIPKKMFCYLLTLFKSKHNLLTNDTIKRNTNAFTVLLSKDNSLITLLNKAKLIAAPDFKEEVLTQTCLHNCKHGFVTQYSDTMQIECYCRLKSDYFDKFFNCGDYKADVKK